MRRSEVLPDMLMRIYAHALSESTRAIAQCASAWRYCSWSTAGCGHAMDPRCRSAEPTRESPSDLARVRPDCRCEIANQLALAARSGCLPEPIETSCERLPAQNVEPRSRSTSVRPSVDTRRSRVELKPNQDPRITDAIRPIAPTTIRMTPTAVRSTSSDAIFTANARIAPTAINRTLNAPIVPHTPILLVLALRPVPAGNAKHTQEFAASACSLVSRPPSTGSGCRSPRCWHHGEEHERRRQLFDPAFALHRHAALHHLGELIGRNLVGHLRREVARSK